MIPPLWLPPLIALALAAAPTDDGVAKTPAKAAARPEFSYDRESAARAFVAQHHPELNALLDRLKPMGPVEYEKAIVELSQISENLASLKARDPGRYGPALDAWKARSRVDLLAAQYALKPTTELEASLRQAIGNQIDCDLAVRRLDREAIAARLRKVDDQIQRLETQRDSTIENRLNALRKKAPRAKAAARDAARSTIASPKKPANPDQRGKP